MFPWFSLNKGNIYKMLPHFVPITLFVPGLEEKSEQRGKDLGFD